MSMPTIELAGLKERLEAQGDPVCLHFSLEPSQAYLGIAVTVTMA